MRIGSYFVVAALAGPLLVSAQPIDDYAAWANKVKAELTRNFKDPSSVMYRGVFVSNSAGFPMLCGELNGKNSYGAYVGFKRFFAGAPPAPGIPGMRHIEEAKDGNVTNAMWPSSCGNKIAEIP